MTNSQIFHSRSDNGYTYTDTDGGVRSSKAKKHGPEAGVNCASFRRRRRDEGGTKRKRGGWKMSRGKVERVLRHIPFIFSAARFISERGFVRAPQRFNPSLRARCRAGIQFSCGLNGPKRVPDRELRRAFASFVPLHRIDENHTNSVQITDRILPGGPPTLARFDRKVIEKLTRGRLRSNVPPGTMNETPFIRHASPPKRGLRIPYNRYHLRFLSSRGRERGRGGETE